MRQDEIIEIAQECNLIGMRPHLDGIYSEALIAFANLVAAKALAKPEQNWRNAALRIGEDLSSVGPEGYYNMTAQQWLDWAMEQKPRGNNSLAQPEQEPVKWCSQCGHKCPLPPQRTWVKMTDEEIDVIDEATWDEDHKSWGIHDFARATEAKLKQKNGYAEEKNTRQDGECKYCTHGCPACDARRQSNVLP